MAGGSKKKKKPAANAARGFATTSVASKNKAENIAASTDDDHADATPPETDGTSHPQGKATVTKEGQANDPSKSNGERDLHELSPEELEQRLEQSELQSFAEQLGPKVRKESSRQISRLQTDRRLLRSPAEFLTLKQWIPTEVFQQILNLLLEEASIPARGGIDHRPVDPSGEATSLMRLWQLSVVLKGIDISEPRSSEALRHVLALSPPEDTAGSIWGLPQVLDWLALHTESEELSDYDAVRSKGSTQDSVQSFDTSEWDGAKAYESRNGSKEQRSGTNDPSRPGYSLSNGRVDDSNDEEDIQVSDLDSDLEPDEMLSKYLDTKLRLFERSPDLATDGARSNGRKMRQNGEADRGHVSSQGDAKLQQRLRTLEADILFDKQTADVMWAEKRTSILRDDNERKRLQIDQKTDKQEPLAATAKRDDTTSTGIMDEAAKLGKELLDQSAADEEDGLLGGMFDSLPDAPDSQTVNGIAPDSTQVAVRAFGKLTGLTARRVFEDACRSRDSGVKIRFQMISPTTYSCRHSVTVAWSKDQEPLADTNLPGFGVYSSTRNTAVKMLQVAAPDVTQSESYVATAAAFLLFSHSPKEEKASLRLAPAFRDLWAEFAELAKERTDSVDRAHIKELRSMMQQQREKEDGEDVVLTASFTNRSKAASGVNTPVATSKITNGTRGVQSVEMKDIWSRQCSTPNYQRMLAARKSLPMYQFREAALSVVRQNQITILCGETGCGKSTQMPSFILEEELSNGRNCKIYCTEPRRISAISLAQRVSEELGEAKGAVGTSRSLVGYAIRLESQTAASTRIVYATVGIVLRMLESEKGISEVTHLVIDEVHERSIDTDFLLIVLRSLLVRRPDLKVILMSATVDAQKFSLYLDNAPIITVPGRTYPVRSLFLEDAIELTGHTNEDNKQSSIQEDDDDDVDPDRTGSVGQALTGYSAKTVKTIAGYDEYKIDYVLIVKLLETVAHQESFTDFSKAVLVFLPGIAEIQRLNDMLVDHPSFARGWLVYPLHSTFSSEEQQAAFQIPPPGMRKIVLATNIAETGITIPDVTCVVDTGKHKEMRFDERRQMSRLLQTFISRANAKQRRGRAGRVQEGMCFHLFTKHRHDEIMAEQQTPEMLRLSLQDLVMRVKICKLGDIEHALTTALDPPSLKNIRRAIDALIEVNALTASEELTPLGHQLARLPLDAQLGKLILLAANFGCLDFALTIAAILSSKSPFLSPMGVKKQADTVRLGFMRGNSDLLTAYNAYTAWRRVCMTPGISEFPFCRKNFLSPQNLANIEDLKGQLLGSLADAGFVSLEKHERAALSRSRSKRNFVEVPSARDFAGSNDLLINSVTAWSFYPKILSRDGKGWRHVANNQSISLHPQSVNKGSSNDAKYLSFYSIMQSSSRFTNAQETSPVTDMALVLMAGDAVFHMYAGVIVIDGNRLRFKVRDWKTMLVLKTLRARIKEILAKGFKNPGRDLSDRQKRWMDIFLSIFEGASGTN